MDCNKWAIKNKLSSYHHLGCYSVSGNILASFIQKPSPDSQKYLLVHQIYFGSKGSVCGGVFPGYTGKNGSPLAGQLINHRIRTVFFSMNPLNVFSGYIEKKHLVCSLVFCLFCKSGPSQAPVRGGLEMSKSTSSTPDFAQRIPLNFWGSLRYLGPLPQKFRGQIW